MNIHPINSTVAAAMAQQQPTVLHRDIESRGVLSLPKVGAWKYAADPRTEIFCVGYAVNNEPVEQWLPNQPVPEEFVEAARNPNWLVCAHNDAFETAIEQLLLHPRYSWPLVPLERHVCTLARCLAHALPGKLELAAQALDLLHQKDRAGQRLMLMMSKPRRPHIDEDPNGLYWFDDEPRLLRLREYNRQDVEVERELHGRLRPLHFSEQQIWLLDQRINNRGFYVDRTLGEAARVIARAVGPEIDAELAQLTGGAVTGVNQVARLKAWLAAQGVSSETRP
jgi:DNA polymerase